MLRSIDGQTKRKVLAGGVASSILAVSLVVSLGIFGGIWIGPGPGPLGPTPTLYSINDTIANDFADYIPYDESYTANAPEYTIAGGLANVEIVGNFPTLSTIERSLIQTNGFVTTKQSEYKQIHEILNDNWKENIPSFVSSDSVLHAFHVLYDLALREAEVWSFWDLLGNLTESMVDSSYGQYLEAPEGRWKEAALRNAMFFSVALSLLDNSTTHYTEVEVEVNQALALIEAHDDISAVWFQGYEEDFTQYVPRGHYTRTDLFKRYFKAMMWYGRVMFRLMPDLPHIPNDRGRNETAQAILMSLALLDEIPTLPAGTTGYNVWDSIYQPTVFFVGAADDLLPTEYLELVQDIYGSSITVPDLDDEILLDEFIEAALTFRDPMILGSILYDFEDMNQTKGLRFMGQRFIPDSFMLGQLVYTYVGVVGHARFMPKGLDVMAAFGSDRAWELLDDQKVYENYESQMAMLWNFVGNLTADDWTQNLYWLWIYSLTPLLRAPGDGYPLFMQSDAWVDKQLMTALSSWTELRHDTILYAKQSYTVYETSIHEMVVGYVEPVPELYARLASLCRMMISGLNERSLLSQPIQMRLHSLNNFLLSLKEISVKELSGTPLNETEVSTIWNSGGTLDYIGSIPTESEELTSDADKLMAVIADVHTDPNSFAVLEEAVGDPMVIYAAVQVYINGVSRVILTRGGTFSYYEFQQSMDNRLTDEAWQEMLDQGQEPDMPDWTSSFVVGGSTSGLSFLAVASRDIE
ncbi:MAG: DUF3160 domain-containing protein [Candidatus Thorarchaeota archaeon]